MTFSTEHIRSNSWSNIAMLGVACGLSLFVGAASIAQTPIAQVPGSPAPSTTAPQRSQQPTRSSAPGVTQSRPATPAEATDVAPIDQFASLDSNRDGKISTSEYSSANMAAFRQMDKDGNGRISGVELTEAQPAASGSPTPSSSAQLGEIDADRDSQITASESASGATRMFENLDIDHDRFLSQDELNRRQYRSDTEASADSRLDNSRLDNSRKESDSDSRTNKREAEKL